MSSDKKTGFTCPVCGKWFMFKVQLLGHMKTHKKG